ncbi:MAG: YeaH/YhbH family protein [Gammaproteobacteria bacterium]|nr:YeaH/YhbH family protein [Gammaproteobacteria bacterium]
MTQIIDRRLNGKNKSAVNRRRFIERFKGQIRQAASEAIHGRSIQDVQSGETVNIPARDTSEPAFRHGPGGRRTTIYPGNKEFVAGDRLPRPDGGAGGAGGSEASDTGEGVDEFVFQLSRDEFLEFFFEDLELPDLVKTELKKSVDMESVRAGYTTDGVPANISVIRSLRGALARRIALRGPYRQEISDAREELSALDAQEEADALAPGRKRELLERIEVLEKKIGAIPFIDTFDLRYNNRTTRPKPATNAVMFCLMDVSGSMDEERKDIAKRFFTLLFLFLNRQYENIEVVFIRHHTSAKEVDEENFFYARETGGTVVSSALHLMREVIAERYPTSDWNIYGAQASDGDNWGDDSSVCRDILAQQIMPMMQYFAYIEIRAERHQSLWVEYESVKDTYKNFAMQEIQGYGDIYPVFRKLLEKRTQ